MRRAAVAIAGGSVMTEAAAQEKKLMTSGGTPAPVNRFFAYSAPSP